MKRALTVFVLVLTCRGVSHAQTAGSAGAYNRELSPAAQELAKRQTTLAETRDDGKSTFIAASLLMNVPADEYVAVFGVTEEGMTPEVATDKMAATIKGFKTSLQALGAKETDCYVDFVTQNRVYDFKVDGTIAQEQLAGFELKKNVSVHFKDKLQLEQFVVAAAKWKIYDLIKVDYIVKDAAAIQDKLEAQTMALIQQKAARYKTGLDVDLPTTERVVADKPSVYYPVEQYDSYQASEAANVDRGYNSNMTLLRLRRSNTTFFNPLANEDYDSVINPVVIEPVVQFTTYIKVQYGVSVAGDGKVDAGEK